MRADPPRRRCRCWCSASCRCSPSACSSDCRRASCRSEDQGAFFVSMRLPDGASTDRTDAAARKIESVIGKLPGRGQVLRAGRTRYRHRHLEFQRRDGHRDAETVGRAHIQRDPARRHSGRSAARVRAGSGGLHLRLRPAADSGTEPHRRFPVHAGRSRRRRYRDPGARRRYPDRRGPQAAGTGYRDQHLPPLGARLLHRHGYRQAPDHGDLAHRRLQYAADVSRRPVRQRLQPVRPYLAGAAAGRARVPRSSPRRWTASTCAIRAATWCRSPRWPPSRPRADPT